MPKSKKIKKEITQVVDPLSVPSRAGVHLAPKRSKAAASSDSEDERPCTKRATAEKIKEDLASWAEEFNISNPATNGLRGILGQQSACIPKGMGTEDKLHYRAEDSLTDFFVDVGAVNELITKQDLVELKSFIENVQTTILKEHQTTQHLLKQILEQVKTASHSKRPLKRKAILPKAPFTTPTEFMEFEKKVQSSDSKFEDLVAELEAQISGNATKFIKMSWRAMMTDDAARHYCWKGTSNKPAVSALSVTAALKHAHKHKFSGATDAEFESTNIGYFQHAKNRLLKREAYKKEAKKKSV